MQIHFNSQDHLIDPAKDIPHLKQILHNRFNISPSRQRIQKMPLLQILRDQDAIEQPIELVQLTDSIQVTLPTGQEVKYLVAANDTIANLKMLLKDDLGVEQDRIYIFCDDRELFNEQLSTLEKREVFVAYQQGNAKLILYRGSTPVIKCIEDANYTFKDLKKMISELEEIDGEQIVLSMHGYLPIDDMAVNCLMVRSRLMVRYAFRKELRVFVQRRNGLKEMQVLDEKEKAEAIVNNLKDGSYRKLFFNGKELDLDKRLEEYRMTEMSVVHLMEKHDFSQYEEYVAEKKYLRIDSLEWEMEYESDMLVQDVKKKIKEEKGVEAECQTLCFKGERLQNEKHLYEYEVFGKLERIELVVRNKPDTLLRIKNLLGVELVLVMNLDDSMADVKREVAKQYSIPVEEQEYQYEDSHPLWDLDREDLKLIRKKSAKHIVVYVKKITTGSCLSIYIDADATVYDLVYQIHLFSTLHPDEIYLIHKGKGCQKERTLRDYSIEDQSVVHLAMRFRGA